MSKATPGIPVTQVTRVRRGPHRWDDQTARVAGRKGGQATSVKKARARLRQEATRG